MLVWTKYTYTLYSTLWSLPHKLCRLVLWIIDCGNKRKLRMERRNIFQSDFLIQPVQIWRWIVPIHWGNICVRRKCTQIRKGNLQRFWWINQWNLEDFILCLCLESVVKSYLLIMVLFITCNSRSKYRLCFLLRNFNTI